MNWLDLLIVILLLFFALEGWRKNFISEILDFLSFLLAFFISLRFYNAFTFFYQSVFGIPHSLATILGFISLWFLIETIFFALAHVALSKIDLSRFDLKRLNYFSFIPSFLRGVVFVAILLVLVGTFPIQPQLKGAVYKSFIGSAILAKAQQLEVPLKNVFGGITQDTLTFLTIKPESNEAVKLGFKTKKFSANEVLEKKMIELVNKERVQRGGKALTFDPSLREVGRMHSGDMFTRGYFSHYTPEGKNVADRANKAGIKYMVVGENLAYAPNLDLAHNGLMNSPGHKANILSADFNKIGIGIMDGGVYGLMITQVFTD